jgi:putative ABC transport system permease protein
VSAWLGTLTGSTAATATTAATGVVPIGPWQLALAAGFMLVVGGISIALELGLVKDLAWATARTYLQLILLGLVLRWVFSNDSWFVVVGLLVLMVVMATRIVIQRAPDAPKGLYGRTGLTIFVSGALVTFAVTGLVIGVHPWYRAQYVIPIAGMVIGNSMTGIALTLERVFEDMDKRAPEILGLLALGASPWEAARASVRTALRAGLIPTINAMAAAGIVFIPGMMTGQILAGADPLDASVYQIVVMLMVAAATAIGSIMAALLTYGRRFDEDGVYLDRPYRPDRPAPKAVRG